MVGNERPCQELITVVAAALRHEVEREPVGARFVFLTPYAEVLEVMKAVVPAAVRSLDVEIPAGFLPDRSQLSAVAWARASGNGWASIGRPLFTIGGWWTYRKTLQADLELIREAHGTTQPVVPRILCLLDYQPDARDALPHEPGASRGF